MDKKEAYDAMKAAMSADSDYAWSWHCNIAMPLIDSGVDAALAQQCASRLMQHFWSVDTSKHEHFATARGNVP